MIFFFHSSVIRQSFLQEGGGETDASKDDNLREMSYSMTSDCR